MLSDLEWVFGFLLVKERHINMNQLRQLKASVDGRRPSTLAQVVIDDGLVARESVQRVLPKVREFVILCPSCHRQSYSLQKDLEQCSACAGKPGPTKPSELLPEGYLGPAADEPAADSADTEDDGEARATPHFVMIPRPRDAADASEPPPPPDRPPPLVASGGGDGGADTPTPAVEPGFVALPPQGVTKASRSKGFVVLPESRPPAASPPPEVSPAASPPAEPAEEPSSRAEKTRPAVTADAPFFGVLRKHTLGEADDDEASDEPVEPEPARSPPPRFVALPGLGAGERSARSEAAAKPPPEPVLIRGKPDDVARAPRPVPTAGRGSSPGLTFKVARSDLYDRARFLRLPKRPPVLQPGDSFERTVEKEWGTPSLEYTVTGEPAEGLMGCVAEVALTIDGNPAPRRLAIKFPWQQHRSQALSVKREAFLKQLPVELRKYVVQVAEAGEMSFKGQHFPFLVMEHLRPNPLEFFRAREIIGPEEGIDPQVALEIFINLLEGLQLLHRAGWVHGDVKPANIMLRMPTLRPQHELHDYVKALLTGAWEPVLCDWGSSWSTSTGPEQGIWGTNRYLAPELFTEGCCGPAMDVYGLGLSLFEMLTGRPPFAEQPVRELKEVEEHHVAERSAVSPKLLNGLATPRYFPQLRKAVPDRESAFTTTRYLASIVNRACAGRYKERLTAGKLLEACYGSFGVTSREIQLHQKARVRLFASERVPQVDMKDNNPYLNPTESDGLE